MSYMTNKSAKIAFPKYFATSTIKGGYPKAHRMNSKARSFQYVFEIWDRFLYIFGFGMLIKGLIGVVRFKWTDVQVKLTVKVSSNVNIFNLVSKIGHWVSKIGHCMGTVANPTTFVDVLVLSLKTPA